jgi:hypothetical protein
MWLATNTNRESAKWYILIPIAGFVSTRVSAQGLLLKSHAKSLYSYGTAPKSSLQRLQPDVYYDLTLNRL